MAFLSVVDRLLFFTQINHHLLLYVCRNPNGTINMYIVVFSLSNNDLDLKGIVQVTLTRRSAKGIAGRLYFICNFRVFFSDLFEFVFPHFSFINWYVV